MSMLEWAEREIALACKRENPNGKCGEWDYGCACYESALRAYRSMLNDGHSGFSWGITKNILMRLMDDKPLTPIEDTPDVWNDVTYKAEEFTSYQCNRMSSLFKDVYTDGTVKYHDNNRIVCVNVNNPVDRWRNGFVTRIVENMFPITMPYSPADRRYEIYCNEFLTDPKNGDFDTIGVLYVVTPAHQKVEINRYFKESDGPSAWQEIDANEYHSRWENRYV